MTVNIVPLVNLFVKLSFFILFLEIFSIKPFLRGLIYAGACVTTVFYITTTIVLFALSTPPPGVSLAQKFASFLEPGRSGFLDTVLAVGYFNLFTDFYILLLPISGVIRLQLPKRRKIGVILVFMTGLLYESQPPGDGRSKLLNFDRACASSCVCLYYRYQVNNADDVTWNIMPAAYLK